MNFEVGFANPKTGIFLIECGSKVGLYSLKEKKEILPCIFDIVREYDVKYGLYEVTLGDKKGIFSVDKGEVICYINKQDPNDESDEEPDREL